MDQRKIFEQYRLPTSWNSFNFHQEGLEVGSLSLQLVGMSLECAGAGVVTGSAVSRESTPMDRAFFELIERACLLECEKRLSHSGTELLSHFDYQGRFQGELLASSLFSKAEDIRPWRFSKSNGVAIHTNLGKAVRNAGWELLERDRVLRFWYSRKTPQPIPDWDKYLPDEIKRLYEIQAYSFSESDDRKKGIAVVGIFGFPKEGGTVPFVTGYGAAETESHALLKALDEVYQRMAFLWDEALPQSLPELNSTPVFHLEYHHCPLAWPHLKKWLSGGLSEVPMLLKSPDWTDLSFTQLPVPPELANLFLIKAHSPTGIPLTFGWGNPKIERALTEQEAIHPIA